MLRASQLLIGMVGLIYAVITKGQYCYPIFVGAAQDFWAGLDLYQVRLGRPDLFKYHPIWALVLTPFLIVPQILGPWLWAALNSFCYWVALGILLDQLSVLLGRSWSEKEKFLGFLLTYPLCLSNLFYGQINAILLLLLVVTLLPRAGLRVGTWALASAMKLFPAALMVFWFLRVQDLKRLLRWVPGVLLVIHLGLYLSPLSPSQLYDGWFRVLQNDISRPHLKIGLLTLARGIVGDEWARIVFYVVLFGAIALAIYGWIRARSSKWHEGILWFWFLPCALFFSHMTEPPTLVLLVPAWLLLFCLHRMGTVSRFWVIFPWFLVTGVSSSLLPDPLRAFLGGDYALKNVALTITFVGVGRLFWRAPPASAITDS